MVRSRSATNDVAFGQVLENGGNGLKPLPGYGGALPAKKRRRERAEGPRKRHKGERRGLCELNLDELYIVRGLVCPIP